MNDTTKILNEISAKLARIGREPEPPAPLACRFEPATPTPRLPAASARRLELAPLFA